jgi:EAL domain-containing protein (putative c-di-GMP-specific phosphodiesterase class I)
MVEFGFNREFFETQMTVFQTGDAGDAAFVIESGCVEVLVGPGDDLCRVAVLAQGAMFGEVALLDRQPRTATVRALVPTVLVRIDRTHVEQLLQRSDPVIQYLLRILLERFRSNSTLQRRDAEFDTTEAAQATAETVDLHAAAVRTLSLAHDLSDAITGDQLALYYQPIVRLSDQRLVGYESLVRWRHPKLGLVNPDEFIPLAEKTGLIHRIGQWVLHRAARDWPHLRGACVEDATQTPFISVNFSAPELCSDTIVGNIESCLAEHGMRAQELRVELTETVVVSSFAKISEVLQQLRAMGVGIALDDFGTGYAGLEYLQSLPFSCLKIDKTFVQKMHSAPRCWQIVKAATELSHQMHLTTIAEGIEDGATGESLAGLGCDYGQGYFYGRPLPLDALLR